MVPSALHEALAEELYQAFQAAKPVPPLTDRHPALAVDDAYAIQQRLIARHLESGDRVVGWKIGLTSRAMQQQLGVSEPDFGRILGRYTFRSGVRIGRQGMVAPRIEGEVAFVLGRDLTGPQVTALEVLAATDAVVPAFEVIDSRIANWRIRLVDTVADNASFWGTVLGQVLRSPRGIDLACTGMVVEHNGEVKATAAGAAVMGHPAEAVAWLARLLAKFGQKLQAGQVVLAGSWVPSLELLPGLWCLRVGDGVGTVTVWVEDGQK